ncbi:pancreatic lipase-related protein 2-like isoform X1 [Lytechinus variegatus]|uniref:pancreatic lipase-related protein 2-like isoform X1 n=1 Tax=Lytechinus variegatus TaxID=7654 RepID=UPI001BB2CF3B|nr:pancreatic lipase-related protein 2-like isoform X1 [Lytechinus variegatus]
MDFMYLTCLIWLSFVSREVLSEEMCYDDVGCFTDEDCHWLGFPPNRPSDINTRFFLYTRRNRFEPQELRRGDIDGLRASNFDPRKKTVFSAHGYTSDSFTSWELDKKNALLEAEDANVICVDWGAGALGLYSKCHQNTRVVGREVGLLARFLNLETGMYYKDVHLVGMSLGAHVMGYAGEFQPGIGRITGLDPAGPYFRDEGFDFRNNGPQCRLDPTDAIFVDVIHTDANDITGLGQMQQMGHQDFYPNGGRTQPGCTESDLLSGCSHMRAVALFSESARSTTCRFTAYPCDSWRNFTAGGCGDCGESGCAVMGFHADQNTAVSGNFYLHTDSQSPYCLQD